MSNRFLQLIVCVAVVAGCRQRQSQPPPPTGYSYPPAAPPADDGRTLVTYDDRFFYAAFHLEDPKPSQIRAVSTASSSDFE